MFRPPTPKELQAVKNTAKAIEERLEVYAVTPKLSDPAYRKQQSLDLVKAVLAIYAGEMHEMKRPPFVTGLRGVVIGQIGVQ